METIRTALLVSLIIILIVILYRRLLKKAGKKKSTEPYAHIIRLDTSVENVEITVELPVKEQIKLTVFNKEDDLLIVLADEELLSGEHLFKWEKPAGRAGKYYCLLETHNQRSTRYFS